MPVLFDSQRIVCLDLVDEYNGEWQLELDLFKSLLKGCTHSNFVELSATQQINPALNFGRRTWLLPTQVAILATGCENVAT